MKSRKNNNFYHQYDIVVVAVYAIMCQTLNKLPNKKATIFMSSNQRDWISDDNTDDKKHGMRRRYSVH